MIEEAETTEAMDELTVLKNRAKLMGIAHSPNIGIEVLRKKIEAKQADELEVDPDAPNPLADETPLTPKQREMSLREQLRTQQLKLVRLRITNLDPKKKDLPGEIVTVANEYLGTVRKYVPFGEATEDGYHVPYIIYEFLKERRFLHIQSTKNAQGQQIVRHRYAPEFALEILPALTKKQIDQLASAQAAAGVFANDEQF